MLSIFSFNNIIISTRSSDQSKEIVNENVLKFSCCFGDLEMRSAKMMRVKSINSFLCIALKLKF